MVDKTHSQDHDWCEARLSECMKELKSRLSTLWAQESMTRAEVVEVQRIEQLISRLENAGYYADS